MGGVIIIIYFRSSEKAGEGEEVGIGSKMSPSSEGE
jgi:hypothetical protein